jgi:integrase
MATIRRIRNKKSISWQVQVRVKGYPPECATFAKKAEAELWVQSLEADMKLNRYIPDTLARKHNAADMIDRYIENVLPVKSNKQHYIAIQRQQLLWWRVQIGKNSLININQFILSEARDKLSKRGLKAGTINRYFAAISHCFNVAMKEWGWIKHNPATLVKKPKEPIGRTTYLNFDEVGRLLEACNNYQKLKPKSPPIKLFVLMAISTLKY